MNCKEKLLEVRDIHKVYTKEGVPTKALNGITFDVLDGEFLGIMGASGSGKTTLLNCIATVIKPTSGQVLLSGANVSSFDSEKLAEYRGNKIGYLFQDFALLDNLTGRENILLPLSIKAKRLGTVLILTARDKLQDELHALGLGADDYLTKPCNTERLLARIKNLLRRKEEQMQQGLLNGGGFLLDPNTFTLYAGKKSYVLPQNEGKILLTLLKSSPNLVSKSDLFHVLWGTAEFIDENALQVNFTRLRKTLREVGLGDRIETVRGQGYRLKERVKI